MRPKKWIVVSGGALLLAAASVVTAPSAPADEQVPAALSGTASASADESPRQRPVYFQMHTDDGNPGGYVTFHPGGPEVKEDLVTVSDIQNDGKDVELDITNVTRDPDTKEYGLLTTGEDAPSPQGHAGMGQPYNMAEGHCFEFRIRLVDEDSGDVVRGSTDYAQWRNNNEETDECGGVD
jgi:hypothetical protein